MAPKKATALTPGTSSSAKATAFTSRLKAENFSPIHKAGVTAIARPRPSGPSNRRLRVIGKFVEEEAGDDEGNGRHEESHRHEEAEARQDVHGGREPGVGQVHVGHHEPLDAAPQECQQQKREAERFPEHRAKGLREDLLGGGERGIDHGTCPESFGHAVPTGACAREIK